MSGGSDDRRLMPRRVTWLAVCASFATRGPGAPATAPAVTIEIANFMAEPQPTTWDSGFLNTHLQERKAYHVLRERLTALAYHGLLTGRRPA